MEAARLAAVARPLPVDRRRVLTHEQARLVYDRAGAKVKDSDSVYGGPAISALLAAADLRGSCSSVFEFGCGSGRLAQRLFEKGEISAGTRYVGVDASPVMVELARERLKGTPSASFRLVPGCPAAAAAPEAPGAFSAVLSTYVLDIMSCDDVAAFLASAWRILEPGGRLCVVNLGEGCTPATRAGSAIWEAVHALAPTVVGGCRSQRLLDYLGPGWEVAHREVVPGGFVASEVLMALKKPPPGTVG